jgi:hypothetical protein
VTSEILTAVFLKIQELWYVTLCPLLSIYQLKLHNIPGDLNFNPTTVYSPLKNISNAPVETRCPSRILHMKNIIIQE